MANITSLDDLSRALAGTRSAPRHVEAPRRSRAAGHEDGRIFRAVVAGREDDWHEAPPAAPAPPPPPATYRVAHAPFVVLRSSPSLAGVVIGKREAGELVKATMRTDDGAWIRLSDGERYHGAEAWMCVDHPQFGVLLEWREGSRLRDLPVQPLALCA